ncbi:MAG: aminodeoxychorismate lyase [Gammaproteobacteria bacterium]
MNSRMPMSRINGAAGGQVAVTDRGLLFGDGVFETLAVRDARPCFWARHMARLQAGCHRLAIAAVDEVQLRAEVEQLLQAAPVAAQYVLKIIITRGTGTRGYRPEPHAVPTRIVQLHDWPDMASGAAGIRATLCSLRLGNNPLLAGIKHLNRLEQVMARSEWDDPDIREGLLLDQAGRVIEGTMSNLFLVKDGVLSTPDLARCGVAGIMRDVVLELAGQQGVTARVTDIGLDSVFQADELFVCNSLLGIWPVIAVNSNRYPRGAVTVGLQARLQGYADDSHTWRA